MGKAGSRVTVNRSAVTGIRIDPGFGTLVVEGVDQNQAGNTLRDHVLRYPPEPLPAAVAEAVVTIRDFATGAVDDA